MRRSGQSPVERISPGMIWTLDRAHMSAGFFTQARSAMSADIVEAVNLANSITDDNHTLSCDHLKKKIPRLGDLALMPDADPLPGKNLRLFLSENLRRGEVRLRESSRPGNKGLDRFAESRHSVTRKGRR